MPHFPYKRWPAHLKEEVLKKVGAGDSLKLLQVDKHSRKFILTHGPFTKPFHRIQINCDNPDPVFIDYEFYCEDTKTPTYTLIDPLGGDQDKPSNVLQFVRAAHEVSIELLEPINWSIEEYPKLARFFPNFRHADTFAGLQVRLHLCKVSELQCFRDMRLRRLLVCFTGPRFLEAAESVIRNGIPGKNRRADVHFRTRDSYQPPYNPRRLFEKTMVAPIDVNSEEGQHYKRAFLTVIRERWGFADDQHAEDEQIAIYRDFWMGNRVFCINLIDSLGSYFLFFSVFSD